MPLEPANALALQIRTLLLDLLGTYADGRKAWRAVNSANALTSGQVGAAVTGGLEAVFSLYPEQHDGRYEFGEAGVRGVLHYALVIKAPPSGTTYPARERVYGAFPLLTTGAARAPRLSPETDVSFETLTLFVPRLAD